MPHSALDKSVLNGISDTPSILNVQFADSTEAAIIAYFNGAKILTATEVPADELILRTLPGPASFLSGALYGQVAGEIGSHPLELANLSLRTEQQEGYANEGHVGKQIHTSPYFEKFCEVDCALLPPYEDKRHDKAGER
nr:hypothetical protein [Pararobbsia alpina]